MTSKLLSNLFELSEGRVSQVRVFVSLPNIFLLFNDACQVLLFKVLKVRLKEFLFIVVKVEDVDLYERKQFFDWLIQHQEHKLEVKEYHTR